MRTITLEILRHGPPHNQLLSPLTPYLALCENHAAVTVTVPFEHAQFLQRLRALSYELMDSTRAFQLEDTGRELGKLLAGIPSLIAELSQRCSADNGQLLHLRMIVSAAELALLPFELVISPNGFPGEGRSLALQTDLPVCLTREVRQASGVSPEWNRRGSRPRILFAAASPPGFDPVPLESHLLALRRAIDPWVFPPDDGEDPTQKIPEHLVVLPQATVEQIREQCATGNFSHVHILAHGVAMSDDNSSERRYGLALHDVRDPANRSIVDGKTLARTLRTDCEGSFSPADPLVVTLASCNGGQVGSVVNFAGAGASVAHALHSEGIPVVIASQFPLSFRGSVLMVETLYSGLLRGDDPRSLVHDLRGKLQGSIPDAHDWASLVAYAALPPGFERQLERFQVDQAHRQVSAALDHVDKLVGDSDNQAQVHLDGRADQRVEVAKERLQDLRRRAQSEIANASSLSSSQGSIDARDRAERHYARISGLIAAAEKRHAELLLKQVDGETNGGNRVIRMLERAMDAYWDTYFYDRSSAWALVQHIYMQCILPPDRSDREKTLPTERHRHLLWESALNASLADLRSADIERHLWARDNLLELRLLQIHLLDQKPFPKRASPRLRDTRITGDPNDHITEILAITGGRGAALYSIRRQIKRFARTSGIFSSKVSSEARSFAYKLQPVLSLGD
ncbi:MAG: CHAT domain-containing protein [Luteolibacter sp.]|uniref:CHAT domain-containing protein n=1 Tax=Luteolibacter sp. TaxID=1962973 RepID=UPI003266F365